MLKAPDVRVKVLNIAAQTAPMPANGKPPLGPRIHGLR
jgi:hypothetical protein